MFWIKQIFLLLIYKFPTVFNKPSGREHYEKESYYTVICMPDVFVCTGIFPNTKA